MGGWNKNTLLLGRNKREPSFHIRWYSAAASNSIAKLKLIAEFLTELLLCMSNYLNQFL